MLDILSSAKDYLAILLEPSMVLLVGILTVLVTKNSNKYDASYKRLTNAYHPIFLAAEPYLFKEIDFKNAKLFVDKFKLIESNFSLYIYPSLHHRVNLLSIAVSDNDSLSSVNEHWLVICRYISSDYDKLCKVTHMPLRSSAYRLNNSQFSSKISLCWGMFKLFFLPYTVFVFMLLGFTFINGLLNSLAK